MAYVTYEALRREAMGLPDEKLIQLIDFARFLKQETENEMDTSLSFTVSLESSGRPADQNTTMKRQFGSLAGGITFIAPDFDDCFDEDPALAGLED